MKWNAPNILTVGRVGLAAVFFALLGLYEKNTPEEGRWMLNAAFVIYIVAGITDVLDGWIARKCNMTSAFGRMLDPIVDKVLVVGGFAMLAGANFSLGADVPGAGVPAWLAGGMRSTVQAWMVVLIAGREFIVSGVRGYSESKGVKFPATPAGKIKMFLQSFAICTILYQLANLPEAAWAIWLKVLAVWASVLATVVSGFVYVGRARRLLTGDE